MSSDSSHLLGQTVGAKIRAARLAKKYTQSQLARPDFSVSYISAIERGQIQPSIRALEILAKRLEISTSDLLPSHDQATSGSSSLVISDVALKETTRELVLLETQIALHQEDAEEAIALLRELLAPQEDQEPDIPALALLGQAYLAGGYLQESEQTLAGVARQAREAQDQLYPRILSLQSAVYAAMHNLTRAIQLQQEGLEALEKNSSKDIFFRTQIYSNLGQYYSHLEQHDRALAMFELALTEVEGRTTYEQLQPVYWDLLQAYKKQEELSQVDLSSHKWLLADFQARLTSLRSEIQHALGRALLKSKPDDAYIYLLAELQKAEKQQDPLLQASINTQLAAWFVARKQFTEAEPYAYKAYTLATPFGKTAIAAEASLLLGEIVYTRKEYQAGDQWFKTGLGMLETLGKDEELVEHLTHYAQLLEARGLLQEAIIYWRRAYEYRQKGRDVPL